MNGKKKLCLLVARRNWGVRFMNTKMARMPLPLTTEPQPGLRIPHCCFSHCSLISSWQGCCVLWVPSAPRT